MSVQNKTSTFSSGAQKLAAIMISALASGCAISMPFQVTDEGKAFISRPDSSHSMVVSVTEATLPQGFRAKRIFWKQIRNLLRVLPEENGLLGYSVRRAVSGTRAWTLTVWKDEPTMQAFSRRRRSICVRFTPAGATFQPRFLRSTPCRFLHFRLPGSRPTLFKPRKAGGTSPKKFLQSKRPHKASFSTRFQILLKKIALHLPSKVFIAFYYEKNHVFPLIRPLGPDYWSLVRNRRSRRTHAG